MKRLLALMLMAAISLSLVACGNGESDVRDIPISNSDDESSPSASIPNDTTSQQIEKSSNPEEDTSSNPSNGSIMQDDDWQVQMEDSGVVDSLKEAFITSWNDGHWSMKWEWSSVGDEILKDVVIFKSTKQGDYYADYYCLTYASVHMQEMYRNDGSTYYKFSDENSELVDAYMYSSISTDSTFLTLDFNGFFTQREDVISSIKDYCGENLISVLSVEQRLALIEAATKNGEVSDTYAQIEALLKENNFVDAQQLYYKINGLTYNQSRDCLLLLTEYELLFRELSPIQGLVDVTGTFTLNSYTLNSRQDEEYSDDENDLIIYVEYHCQTTHPIMGNKAYQDYLTIPVTLDVEGKTFVKRS